MKKLIVLISTVLVTVGLYAQTPVLEIPIAGIGSTYPVSIGVTNAISSDFTWTKTGGNSVITNAFPVTDNSLLRDTQYLSINAAVTVGMSSTISVTAVNHASPACATAASDLIVNIVNTPTYVATIPIATQNICQGSTAANISVRITGPVGSTINTFSYNINGTIYPPAAVGLVIPAAGFITASINMSGVSTATVSPPPVVVTVTSVSGTNGGIPSASGQAGVIQTITINAIPVLGNFSF